MKQLRAISTLLTITVICLYSVAPLAYLWHVPGCSSHQNNQCAHVCQQSYCHHDVETHNKSNDSEKGCLVCEQFMALFSSTFVLVDDTFSFEQIGYFSLDHHPKVDVVEDVHSLFFCRGPPSLQV